jgi:hypothetical protein
MVAQVSRVDQHVFQWSGEKLRRVDKKLSGLYYKHECWVSDDTDCRLRIDMTA